VSNRLFIVPFLFLKLGYSSFCRLDCWSSIVRAEVRCGMPQTRLKNHDNAEISMKNETVVERKEH
jgi:hypothetical protein